MFKIIKSNRPEIEIWHIFALYSKKQLKTLFLHMHSKNLTKNNDKSLLIAEMSFSEKIC